MSTLLSVFSERFNHVKFNAQLAKQIYQFQVAYVNKNQEHMEFFGGNLTGVNVLRMTDKDFKIFYNDILGVDQQELAAALLALDSINENWKISSDCFNLTCMYLIHAFMTSKIINTKDKERACLDIALLFNYRCITALITYYFRYPIDNKLAEATYAELSQRFLIKKLGSWSEVMIYRAQSMISKDNPNYNALLRFNDDYGVIVLINDSQGRVKDMIKNIYAEFIKVHRSGGKIATTSSVMIDADGEEIVKDKTHGLETYTSYLMTVLPDEHSFVKQELVDIIVKLVYTCHRKNLEKTLYWLSEHYISDRHNEIEHFVKLVMVHSYQYLLEHSFILKNKQDIAGLLSKLRNVYISSRSNDSELNDIRAIGDKMIKEAVGKINDQATASVRIGLVLYLSLRAYTKNHYTDR
jgi:hypothetical protein